MPRPLGTTRYDLGNGVTITCNMAFQRPKSRLWTARYNGAIIGEFKTWQATVYQRQEPGTYGRGPGKNKTVMRRESWLRSYLFVDNPAVGELETRLKPNTTRYMREWKKILRTLPHPNVRIIARESVSV